MYNQTAHANHGLRRLQLREGNFSDVATHYFNA